MNGLDRFELSDEWLIERFKEGDETAFDQLVRRYEQKVFQHAYRLTGNTDDAADVAAEAFLRMYTALKRFRGDAQLSTWLYRIVQNVYFDFYKREQRHQHLPLEISSDEDDEPMELPIPDESADLHAQLLERERERVLREAIDQLPDYQRVVMILFHVEQLSYEEIAVATGLPLGTIKSRLNRARATLRTLLEPYRELFEAGDSPTYSEPSDAVRTGQSSAE
ncbi:ECF RNA polymerase sigma factor SigW [bacterium HR15]|nr:ECF RNA polymerase sigma factor SigW [bacterium HR15]